MTLLWLLVLLLGIAVLAHLRVAPRLALAIVATYLIFMTAAEPSGVVVLLLWLVLIAVAVPLLVADVRLRYFSGPMSTGSRKSYRRFPPPSATPSTPAPSGGMASCSAAARIGTPCSAIRRPVLRMKNRPFSTAQPKPSVRWPANGTSPNGWTCRPPPGTTSRPKASLP